MYGISGTPGHEAGCSYKGESTFLLYRLAKGVTGILSYAKEGVRLWFRTKRPRDISLLTVSSALSWSSE